MQMPQHTEPSGHAVMSSGLRGLGARERWYAVHTLPFGEVRAAGHLENQAFRTFLPKRRKTVRHARKLTTLEAPFFPRYLFVALDLTRQRWRSVVFAWLSTRRRTVCSIVGRDTA